MAEITGSARFLISPAILERVFAAANVVALTAERFYILEAAPRIFVFL